VRSASYDKPAIGIDDTAVVETIAAISESFEAYGYRWMQAALRLRGLEEDPAPDARTLPSAAARRRYVATTDSDHELPLFPNLVKNLVPNGPNQLGQPTSPTTQLAIRFCGASINLRRSMPASPLMGFSRHRSIGGVLSKLQGRCRHAITFEGDAPSIKKN
jgi:putative transposase